MKRVFIFFIILFIILISLSIILSLVQNRFSPKENIALIRVEGPILSSRDTVKELKKHIDDPSVKAIVLRVDSPGGAVVPAQEIYSQVKKAVRKKSVVVSMGSLAASGGYYISAAATKIVANPGTITGSIGVIMEIPNVRGLMDKVGIKSNVIKSVKHKDLASAFRELKEDDKKILQDVVTDVHNQFVEAIAESRKMPIDDIRKLSDGRIFTGLQAKTMGLVDMIGNLQDAIQEAATIAGIKGEPNIVSSKEDFSIIELLKNKLSIELLNLTTFPKLHYMLDY